MESYVVYIGIIFATAGLTRVAVQQIEGTINPIGKVLNLIVYASVGVGLYLIFSYGPIFQYSGFSEIINSFGGILAGIAGIAAGFFIGTSHE